MTQLLNFFTPKNTTLLQQKEFEQAEQELRILTHDFKTALCFLKKNRKSYFQNKSKSKLPFNVVIGTSCSGKTTLLSQTGLGLIDINKQPPTNIVSTKYCNWWFAKDSIYLDTAGVYTKPDTDSSQENLIWRGFVKQLRKQLGTKFINSLIVVLDTSSLLTDTSSLSNILFCLRERIYELAKYTDQLPISIVFTKCDLLAGFTEFFAYLTKEERNQTFGIEFDMVNSGLDPTQLFTQKFAALLNRLNEQSIHYIHDEQNLDKRAAIATFPLQIENLRPTIEKIIHKIPTASHINLTGIYFTSSIQRGVPFDPLEKYVTNTFNLHEKNIYKPERIGGNSYFIADLFKKIANSTTKNAKTQMVPDGKKYSVVKKLFRFDINIIIALVLGILIIGASSFIWQRSYQKNINTFHRMQLTLGNPQNLDSLNKISLLRQNLIRIESSPWVKLALNQIQPLTISTAKFYQITTIKTLQNLIENDLKSQLLSAASTSTSNGNNLYTTLKVYLMLSNPEKADPEFIKNWLNSYWKAHPTSSIKEKQLQEQITINFDKHYITKINADNQLIENARNNLLTHTPIQLIYLLLEDKYANETQSLISKNIGLPKDTSLSTSNLIAYVPKMYTADRFNVIYRQQIPNFAHNHDVDDWVLNKHLNIQLSPQDTEKMITQLQERYMENYIAIWEKILNSISINQAKTIKEAAQQLADLANSNKLFLQSLTTIQSNLIVPSAPTEFSQLVSQRFPNLNKLDVNTLHQHLVEADNYFNKIIVNPDINKAAFSAVAAYFQAPQLHNNSIDALQRLAVNEPQPIQSLLRNITNNYWSILLDNAHNQIAAEWNNVIVAQYQQTISNKYPVFTGTKNEISLADFNTFFSPNGTMDRFFTTYLKPFVTIQGADFQSEWTWKVLDNKDLHLANNYLISVRQAALIQKMFYPNNNPTPAVRFSLQPTAMTPNTARFVLNLEGQLVTYDGNQSKIDNLVWPGHQQNGVTIEFTTKDGRHFTASQPGTWAWFKLLTKANIHHSGKGPAFALTFDLNGNAAQYKLIADQPINPFVTDLISKFRCET